MAKKVDGPARFDTKVVPPPADERRADDYTSPPYGDTGRTTDRFDMTRVTLASKGSWRIWSVSWWGSAHRMVGFARFCEQELGLEAEELLEALAKPFAERVQELEELSTRYEVEADAEGAEEYLALMTEAWRRALKSA